MEGCGWWSKCPPLPHCPLHRAPPTSWKVKYQWRAVAISLGELPWEGGHAPGGRCHYFSSSCRLGFLVRGRLQGPTRVSLKGRGHEATDTGLAYAPVSQAHGHHPSVQCFALLHCRVEGRGGGSKGGAWVGLWGDPPLRLTEPTRPCANPPPPPQETLSCWRCQRRRRNFLAYTAKGARETF